MPLHHVTVESTVDPHRTFEIDEVARSQPAYDASLQRLAHHIEIQVSAPRFARRDYDRETYAVHRERRADRDVLADKSGAHAQHGRIPMCFQGDDLAELLDDAGEQRATLPRPTPAGRRSSRQARPGSHCRSPV